MKNIAKSSLSTLLFLFLFSHSLFAQRQFLQATLTTNSGEKLTWKVEVQNWSTTPRRLFFSQENGTKRTYEIADLQAFEIVRQDGERDFYVRRSCELEVSPTRTNDLERGVKSLRMEKDTVWLLKVASGSFTLYKLGDSSGKDHFFVETERQPPVELLQKQWLESQNQAVGSSDYFRSQLHELTKGCKPVFALLPELRLREKELVEVLKAYDQCQGVVTYVRKPEKNTLTGQVLFGGHVGSVNLLPFYKETAKGLKGGQVGFGTSYFFGKTNRRLAFYNELMLFNHSGTDLSKGDGTTFIYLTEIKYQTVNLGLSNMMAVRLTRLAIAPTLKLGMFHNFNLSKNVTRRHDFDFNFPQTQPTPIDEAIRTYEFGVAGAFGFQYQRFGLELRHFRTQLVGKWRSGNEARTKFFGVSLSYRLF